MQAQALDPFRYLCWKFVQHEVLQSVHIIPEFCWCIDDRAITAHTNSQKVMRPTQHPRHFWPQTLFVFYISHDELSQFASPTITKKKPPSPFKPRLSTAETIVTARDIRLGTISNLPTVLSKTSHHVSHSHTQTKTLPSTSSHCNHSRSPTTHQEQHQNLTWHDCNPPRSPLPSSVLQWGPPHSLIALHAYTLPSLAPDRCLCRCLTRFLPSCVTHTTSYCRKHVCT